MELTIRNMSQQDIEFAMRLVDDEQWGYSAMELERMLELNPDGSFVAEQSGTPSGLVTTSSFSRTGAIGHIVVAREKRNKALGAKLMERALQHLDDQGVTSVVLNAVQAATGFYERFGFRTAFPLYVSKLEFERSTKERLTPLCPNLLQEDLAAAVSLDQELFGDDRRRILSRLYSEFPEHAFKYELDGRLLGFVLGRRTPVGSDVGPWICHPCSRDAARSMLESVFTTFSPGLVHAATFPDNLVAQDSLGRMGKMQSFDTFLMIRGERRYPGPRESILGLAATEFG